MTYYILLKGDSVDDIWDNNILGEESFGTFYTGNGFKALDNILCVRVLRFNYKMENNVLTCMAKVEYI